MSLINVVGKLGKCREVGKGRKEETREGREREKERENRNRDKMIRGQSDKGIKDKAREKTWKQGKGNRGRERGSEKKPTTAA